MVAKQDSQVQSNCAVIQPVSNESMNYCAQVILVQVGA